MTWLLKIIYIGNMKEIKAKISQDFYAQLSREVPSLETLMTYDVAIFESVTLFCNWRNSPDRIDTSYLVLTEDRDAKIIKEKSGILSQSNVELVAKSMIFDVLPLILAKISNQQKSLQRFNELTKALQQKLERTTTMQRVFLNNVTHELITPLNTIIGYTELLREELGECNPSELDDDLHSVQKAACHLKEIIYNVIQLANLEVFQLSSNYIAIKPEILKKALCDIKDSIFAKSSNTCSIEIASNTEQFLGDLDNILLAIRQIVSNSNKFTKNGQVTIKVSQGISFIKITITDTGIGMGKSDITKILNPFTQLDPSESRMYGGLGIGLTLVKKIMECLHGDIQLSSTPMQGTSFTLVIPTRMQEETSQNKKLA